MRTLFAVVSIFSLITQLQFSVYAKNSRAFTTTGNDSQVITLAQATTDVQLEKKETEPVYETRQVPDTCTRQVQHGTRQECHTEYDRQCHTEYNEQCNNVAYPVCQTVQENVCNPVSYPVCQTVPRNECRDVPYPVCANVPQQVCSNVPSQECHAQTVPVCQSVPRNVCESVQQCTTVQDSVCQGTGAARVCHTVPRRQCAPVQQCHTVQDSVCHNETRNQCSTVYHQQCHSEMQQQCHNESRRECRTVQDSVCHNETRQDCRVVDRQACHDEYRRECRQVPNEQCQDIPRQACADVPVMVDESYACTRDVQVQTGERTTSHIMASVRVILANFGKVDVSNESLKVALSPTDGVALTLAQGSNHVLFRIVKKDQKVQNQSEVDQQITTTFTVEAISTAQLEELAKVKITNTQLTYDQLRFQLLGADLAKLGLQITNGHLKMVYDSDQSIAVDQDLDASMIKQAQGAFAINFQDLDMDQLEQDQFDIELILNLGSSLKAAELVNPQLLDQLLKKPVSGTFSVMLMDDQGGQ